MVVYGQGNKSCGDWTRSHREDSVDFIAKVAWLGGFISGQNAVLSAVTGKSDLLEGSDMAAAIGWIDNYCVANPLDQLEHAAVVLSTALMEHPKAR
jgi:hypothetical protein